MATAVLHTIITSVLNRQEEVQAIIPPLERDLVNEKVAWIRQEEMKEIFSHLSNALVKEKLILDETEYRKQSALYPPELRSFFSHRIWTENRKGHNSLPVRAYFIFKIYQILTGKSLEEAQRDLMVTNLMITIEICITIMYLENHYIDNKFGISGQSNMIDQAFLHNRKQKADLEIALDSFIESHFDNHTKPLVRLTCRSLFSEYESGNLIDKHDLSFGNFEHDFLHKQYEQFSFIEELALRPILSSAKKKYPSLSNTNYLKTYLLRSYLINAVLFHKFAQLCIDLFSPDPVLARILSNFAAQFGIVQQLVNDVSDHVPVGKAQKTSAKLPEDTFSDLRRGLITLTGICYQSKKEENEHSDAALKNKLTEQLRYCQDGADLLDLRSHEAQATILQELRQTGALSHSMHLAHQITLESEKKMGEYFWGNDHTMNNLKILADLGSISRANQPYQTMREM